jgi:hypothetical protein
MPTVLVIFGSAKLTPAGVRTAMRRHCERNHDAVYDFGCFMPMAGNYDRRLRALSRKTE